MSRELAVAKFGSGILVSDDFDTRERLSLYASTLLRLHEPNDLIIVSSGAVALGKREIEEMGDDPNRFTLQQKAQMGSTTMVNLWKEALAQHKVKAGALFVTHHEIDTTGEGAQIKSNLEGNREVGLVPIINENDALSNIELMKLFTGGENDGMARHVAQVMDADVAYFFTKRGGIRDDEGKHIAVVHSSNKHSTRSMIEARAVSSSGVGRGGIAPKNHEAITCAETVCRAYIAPPPVNGNFFEHSTYYPRTM